jgi:photosystem II stability/assembly factor-like uncharacterized protein
MINAPIVPKRGGSMRDSRSFQAAAAMAASILFLSVLSGLAADKSANPLLGGLTFRNLGPFRAGSWVTSLAVPLSPPRAHLYTLYVGTRNGGVWKTTNNGTTFEPVFDAQQALSIGDVAVAPSNPEVVWVGTGEAYCARSSNSGDGIYKSTDGGKTWTRMGLVDSQHIARIVVHPSNPDIVYVAVMGHLFSTNEERGVFKTTDGGKTWQKVLYENEKVGAVDLAMVQAAPDVLYAAMYEKVRLPWHYEPGGPGSGIYKTTDGGATWERLTGGLPAGRIGRIGLDIFQPRPDILYAIVENANKRPPTKAEAEQDKRRGLGPRERTVGVGVYRTTDGGKSWEIINAGKEAAFDKAPYSFNQLRVDPHDSNKVYCTGQALVSTMDGGKTWTGLGWPPDGVFQKAFGDFRTLYVDPLDGDRLIFGSDGGVYVSYDGGKTCHHFYNIPLGEFYAVGVDMEDPYNVYGGLQDHESWKGPSNGWAGEISLADWVTVGEGDGMYNCVDPGDSRWVYNNREFGLTWRLDQKTGARAVIMPRREKGQEPYRFNWTPPIMLSPQNGAIVYTGAQVLLRSLDRGDHWEEISPDLTTNDRSREGGEGNITFCTITTLSESPVRPGVIWVGTDDGKVQVTRDHGATWADCTPKVAAAGGPAELWVSRVLASPHDAGTAFVAKTGFRQDIFKPYVFKTADFGETWTSIAGDLPDKPVNVILQDRKKADLLFSGTDHGLYVSFDGGTAWAPFKSNLPWVKVTDLVIHPRENDLVVASYGRGLWITDITPLQEWGENTAAEDVHLFAPRPGVERTTNAYGNYELQGDDHLLVPNEPDGIVIRYLLKEKAAGKMKIAVTDPCGKVVRELDGPGDAGLNRIVWDMRLKAEAAPEGAPFFGPRRGPLVAPGEYVVVLEAAGQRLTQKAVVRGRQGWSIGPFPLVLR